MRTKSLIMAVQNADSVDVNKSNASAVPCSKHAIYIPLEVVFNSGLAGKSIEAFAWAGSL